MRMLEGKAGPEAGGSGLIERNLAKRRLSQRHSGSEEAAEAVTHDEVASARVVNAELFGKCEEVSVPQHDTLFPLLQLWSIDRDLADEVMVERLLTQPISDAAALRSLVSDDLAAAENDAGPPSRLFCDMNGDPLLLANNQDRRQQRRLERWHLFSTYVKLRLWWRSRWAASASEVAQEYAYRISNYTFQDAADIEAALSGGAVSADFKPTGRRVAIRYGRLFLGQLAEGMQPSAFLQRAGHRLRRLDLELLLLRCGGGGGGGSRVACLVTHRTSISFLRLQSGAGWLSAMLLAAAAVPLLVEHPAALVVPAGAVAAVTGGLMARRAAAAAHGVGRLLSPACLVLPMLPHAGIMPACSAYHTACLPNRACAFDLSAAASIASLAASAAFLLASASSPGSAPTSMLLVPADLFAYSGLMTWLLLHAPGAAGSGEVAAPLVAVAPSALAGLLGLNFALLGLVPLAASDGGRMLAALLGRGLLRAVSAVAFLLVAARMLLSGHLLPLLAWSLSYVLLPEESFQRDEVSPVGLLRAAVGLPLIAAAMLGFLVPVQLLPS